MGLSVFIVTHLTTECSQQPRGREQIRDGKRRTRQNFLVSLYLRVCVCAHTVCVYVYYVCVSQKTGDRAK